MGYKWTEVGVIPEDWKSSTIRAIASSSRNAIVGGPFGSDLVSKDYVAHGVPVIRGQNMRGRWVSGSFVFVTPMKAKSLEANLAYPGDIIFTQRGTLGQVSMVPGKPISTYLVSQSQMKLSVDRQVTDPLFLFYFFTSDEQQKLIQGRTIQTGVPHINLGILSEIPVRLPPLAEQRAIAEALSDVDGLLGALEELIAQKRAIKQAAMQQLLTGKTRLPGFSGEWEMTTLGEVADIRSGATPSTQIGAYWNGPIPWCTPTDITATPGKYLLATERSVTAAGLASCAASLLPVGALLLCSRATIGEIKIATSPVCTNQGFKSLVCKHNVFNEFLYYLLLILKPQMIERAIGSTFLEIGKRDVASIELFVPTYTEQRAIAAVLSDMDAEIAALEKRKDKVRTIKQGMMQQLLSGRIRLIQPETTTEELAVTRPVGRKHNWQFNEAVVISVLVKHFGNEQYPLGRMRYTKLSYLLHRYEEGHAEGYLKKAAGPYNPQTRYGGPEKIALEKDYMRQHRSGKGQGFIASNHVDEAERYFDRWYGSEVLQWLERFRYETNNDLELLTTVDMAAEELCEAGEEVSVESIKKVVRSHPEWNPKLDRSIFSDTNLASAIEICQKLFRRKQ